MMYSVYVTLVMTVAIIADTNHTTGNDVVDIFLRDFRRRSVVVLPARYFTLPCVLIQKVPVAKEILHLVGYDPFVRMNRTQRLPCREL